LAIEHPDLIRIPWGRESSKVVPWDVVFPHARDRRGYTRNLRKRRPVTVSDLRRYGLAARCRSVAKVPMSATTPPLQGECEATSGTPPRGLSPKLVRAGERVCSPLAHPLCTLSLTLSPSHPHTLNHAHS
jgi:hypothetical protein